MASDVIPLGTVPAHESSARIGQTGYAEIAFLQCRRDFDPYIEVVVEYDDKNTVARAYATRCERDAPKRWK